VHRYAIRILSILIGVNSDH